MPQNVFKIDQFVTNFTAAGARPSLYHVQFDGLEVPDVTLGEEAGILCKNAQLPASNLGQIPVNFLGRQIKLPGTRTYEDLSLTFYNDENFKIRHNIEKWMHSIGKFQSAFGNKVRIGKEGTSASSCTIKVSQLSKDNTTLRTYQFHYAFPTIAAAIDLGYDQADAIEEFAVTFAYSYFDIPEATGDSVQPILASDEKASATG